MSARGSELNALLIALKKGDENALASLFDLYSSRVYAFCYKRLKSKDLSDDVVIEVFTKLWDRRKTLKLDTSFEAYLFTIARNHLSNLLKKIARDEHLQEQLIQSSQYYYHLEDEDPYHEYLTLAEQFVNKMPPQRQKVFRLRLEEGLSYKEIGNKLGLSNNTVKYHLSEASKNLREAFKSCPDISFPVLILLLYICR